MLDESYYRKTDEIIARYGKEPKALIPVMQDVQAEYRYLPGRHFPLCGPGSGYGKRPCHSRRYSRKGRPASF